MEYTVVWFRAWTHGTEVVEAESPADACHRFAARQGRIEKVQLFAVEGRHTPRPISAYGTSAATWKGDPR